MTTAEHRAIKRPRTDSNSKPEATAVAQPKKKKKKSKVTKNKKTEDEKPTKSKTKERESTATVEGQQMAQVLSTFNRLEQSRFEAFRKATFRGDAISTYVSHCLQVSHERAFARGEKTRQYLGGNSLGVGNASKLSGKALHQCPYVLNRQSDATTELMGCSSSTSKIPSSTSNNSDKRITSKKQRPLEDMVAPNQAEEIRVVVSTLAKAYAQRLITASRRVAASEGHDADKHPLNPKHVLQAHQSRMKAGLDPGFFLQSPPLSAETIVVGHSAHAAALGIPNRNQLERDAALAAQEDYDKRMKIKQDEEKRQKVKEEEEKKEKAAAEAKQKKEGEEPEKVEDSPPSVEKDIKMEESTKDAAVQDDNNNGAQTLEDALMEDMDDD